MKNYVDGILVWGDADLETVNQMKEVINYEIKPNYAALMADHHLGYSVPVGGVVSYEKHINVNGVGFDIACGNKAMLLDCSLQAVKDNFYRTMKRYRNKWLKKMRFHTKN